MSHNFIRNRTDVSEWLIHFVRDRDPDNDFPDEDPYEYVLEADANAYAVLRAIIDSGGIFAGYSFRNGKTTIYGGAPAVCMTEAPLYNFVQYVVERQNASRCTHYGICLPKREVFAAGGRPAIYGLSTDLVKLTEDTRYTRVLDPNVLPMQEQYRYVAYDPNCVSPLDWTHEREWRWVLRDQKRDALGIDTQHGIEQRVGLPLFRDPDDGGYFSRIGFLVRTTSEAKELAQKLLRYADAGGNNIGEEYSSSLLRGAFVVPLEEVETRKVQRIEDLTEDLRVTGRRPTPSSGIRRKVCEAVAAAKRASEHAAAEFLKSATLDKKGQVVDACGYAWIITYASSTEIMAAMIEEGIAHSPTGEYYVVDALGELGFQQAVSYHEVASRAAADYLTDALGQTFHSRSWLD